MKNKSHSLVGVIMGSKSDWKTMIHCCDTLKKFGVKHEVKVISAHRTPNRLHKFLNEAKKNNNRFFSLKFPNNCDFALFIHPFFIIFLSGSSHRIIGVGGGQLS